MPTNYPASIDNLTNPATTDAMNSSTVSHAGQHGNANDAIEAIETALGANLVNVARIASANTFTTSPQMIDVSAAGSKGLVVQGAASQTANLQEFQNSASTVLTAITSAGTINFASGNTAASATAGLTSVPALAVGFLTFQVNGTTVKVPYFAV